MTIKQKYSLSIQNQQLTNTFIPKGRRCKSWQHLCDIQHAHQTFGMTIDFNMSLERHVTNISRTAYYHLYSTGCIRRYFQPGHTQQLRHALVISRIDCCNSLLNGLSVAVVEKLQCIQNACAHIILIHSQQDHVTPMPLELHWLPVKSRITFKILLLTCTSCSNNPASYGSPSIDLRGLLFVLGGLFALDGRGFCLTLSLHGYVFFFAKNDVCTVGLINSIFLELKYVFISNILTWLCHFTRCNRLGHAQVARHN